MPIFEVYLQVCLWVIAIFRGPDPQDPILASQLETPWLWSTAVHAQLPAGVMHRAHRQVVPHLSRVLDLQMEMM